MGASGRSLALLFSPITLLVAAVLHPPHAADGDSWLAAASVSSPRFYVAHVLFLLAAVALVPAAAAMADVLEAAGVRRARVAATLTAMGALGIAAFVGTDLFVWRMAHGPATHSEMLVFLRDAASSPAVVGPMAALIAAVALGAALFAIQLWRAEALHIVPATMLAAGPLLFGVLPARPVSISGAVCLLVGVVTVARGAGPERAVPGANTAPAGEGRGMTDRQYDARWSRG